MKNLQDYLSLFKMSPLREETYESNTIRALFSKEAEQLMEDAKFIVKRSSEPLNIVILGEVKAGKSSLINAILQDDVSPVDVTEATSCIVDVSFGEEPDASLQLDGQVVKTGSRDDVWEYYAAKSKDIHIRKQRAEIRLCLNTAALKNLHLVDTPGLETINANYENATVNFFNSSDVIIWVFNANHAGQSDVRERLSAVAKLGKPMIGVVSRIDEIGNEADVILNYFRNNYSLYFQKIIGFSALWARTGLMSKDGDMSRSSGIKELLEHLKEIDDEVKRVKSESTLSSMRALALIDKATHELARNRVEYFLNQMQLFRNKCDYHRDSIGRSLEGLAEDWLENKFLEEEEVQVLAAINDSHGSSEISSMVKQAVSNDNINRRLEELFALISSAYSSEWKIAVENISLELSRADELHLSFQKKIIAEVASENITLPEMLIDGVKKGAAVGGAFGLVGGSIVVAMTAATMPALLVIVPFYALIGTLAGGIANLFGLHKNKEKLKREVGKEFRRARAEFGNHYMSEFQANLNKVMRSTVIELTEKFSKTADIPQEAVLQRYKESLNKYLISLDATIESEIRER